MTNRTRPCSGCGQDMATKKTDGTQMCHPCRRGRRDPQRVCAECGQLRQDQRRGRRCTPCRYERAKRLAAEQEKFCVADGCGSPATVKNLCLTHYSYRYRQQSGYVRKNYPKPVKRFVCTFCAVEFETQESVASYCSRECHRHDRLACSPSREVELQRSSARRLRAWVGLTLPSHNRPFVVGPCAHCGETFVSRTDSKYCSKTCASRAAWKRRYDLRGEFYVSPRERLAIYDRDGWDCQLCFEPVPPGVDVNDDLAATLDHIVPQSLQLIPDHSPQNLRLAHRACNVRRSNLMEYEHLFA